jgi:hypothetical protein
MAAPTISIFEATQILGDYIRTRRRKPLTRRMRRDLRVLAPTLILMLSLVLMAGAIRYMERSVHMGASSASVSATSARRAIDESQLSATPTSRGGFAQQLCAAILD